MPSAVPPCVSSLPPAKAEKPTQGRVMEYEPENGFIEAQTADPSLVHSLETTARHQLPTDYQSLKFAQYPAELAAAIGLYCRMDTTNTQDRVENLLSCRHFAWFVRHEDTGRVKVIANACHLRWCPVCAGVKRMVIKSAVAKWLKTVKRPKFMTFTVKHSTEPLSDQIRRLYKAYRLFRQHRFLKKKQRGGVWFFQLKRSEKTGEWHPHLHVIVDMDYVNKVEIQDEWLLVTGDSFVVDIRAIKDPGKVVDYVARYCASPCNLANFSNADQDTLGDSLHGKRLCGRFGSGNNCNFKPQKPVDATKWQRLVAWTDCVVNQQLDSELNRVIKAWSTNGIIDTETASRIGNTYAPSAPMGLHVEKTKTDPQKYFEEFQKCK